MERLTECARTYSVLSYRKVAETAEKATDAIKKKLERPASKSEQNDD